jgi:hypothetical protein
VFINGRYLKEGDGSRLKTVFGNLEGIVEIVFGQKIK